MDILSLFSVYQVRNTSQFSDEILRLAIGSMVSAMCLAGILFLSYRDVSRLFFVLFVIVMIWLLPRIWVGVKKVFRFIIGWFRNEQPPADLNLPQ